MIGQSGDIGPLPRSEGPLIERVMVAVDGSENSTRASQVGADLAHRYGAELVILNVIPSAMSLDETPMPHRLIHEFRSYTVEKARKIVDEQRFMAENRGVRVRGEVSESPGSIVQGIVDYAGREQVDLIVIGTRGLGDLKKLLVGSVSSGVIARAQCPVLVVR